MDKQRTPELAHEQSVLPQWLTEAECSEYAGVSRSFLQKARCGYFDGPPFVNEPGVGIRYPKDGVDQWQASKERHRTISPNARQRPKPAQKRKKSAQQCHK